MPPPALEGVLIKEEILMREPDHRRHSGKLAIGAAALSALLVAAPQIAARAQSTTDGDTRRSSNSVGAADSGAPSQADTIDERITSLHASLQITPAEEPAWKAVAQTMRENADAMDKLASEKQARSTSGMTAVEDLQTYSTFAQAHVDHLRKLTSVFETLYNAMPANQKKVADQVFARSHQGPGQKQG